MEYKYAKMYIVIMKAICRILSVTLLFLLVPGGAKARLEKDAYTETEKVGFAFHHFSRIKPDFLSWVAESDVIHAAMPAQRAQLLRDQTQRLESGFNAYNPDEDLIFLKTGVHVEASDFTSDNPVYRQNKIVKKSTLTIPGMPESYIPFQVGDLWVAMVPQDYASFTNLYLTREQFDKLCAAAGYRNGKFETIRFDGEIDFVLRPVKVDTRKPFEIEGQEMWLMGAQIANMVVWSRNREKLIWDYTAPWYKSEETKQILDLYHD